MISTSIVALTLFHLATPGSIAKATPRNPLEPRASPTRVPITNKAIDVTIGTATVPLLVDTGSNSTKGGKILGFTTFEPMGTWQSAPVDVGGLTIEQAGYLSAWKLSGDPEAVIFPDNLSGGFGLGLPGTSREGGIGGLGTARPGNWAKDPAKHVECNPVWLDMVTANSLPRMFGLELSSDDEGELTLGGHSLDNERYDTISWNEVYPLVNLGNDHWTIELDRVTMGEQSFPGGRAVIDSGSGMIYGRDEHVAQIYEVLSDLGVASKPPPARPSTPSSSSSTGSFVMAYVIDCDASIPTATFVFNDVAYPLSSETFIVRRADGKCIGAVAGGDDVLFLDRLEVDWLVGSPFLKNVYSVWEAPPSGDNRIGFARPL